MAKMTVSRLKKARDLPMEISCLEAEIEEMKKGDNGIDSDTILNYRTGYGVPEAVTGFDWSKYDRKEELLMKKRKELRAVTKWIDDVEDELTKQVLLMRYIDRLSWKVIAKRTGTPHNEDYPRVCVQDAYFKKIGLK